MCSVTHISKEKNQRSALWRFLIKGYSGVSLGCIFFFKSNKRNGHSKIQHGRGAGRGGGWEECWPSAAAVHPLQVSSAFHAREVVVVRNQKVVEIQKTWKKFILGRSTEDKDFGKGMDTIKE